MKTVLLLIALASVAIAAPSMDAAGPGPAGPAPTARSDEHQRRVARQVPGADILTRISEAFQEHVAQKVQPITDFLGSLGVRVPVPNLSESLPTGIVSMAQDAAKEDDDS